MLITTLLYFGLNALQSDCPNFGLVEPAQTGKTDRVNIRFGDLVCRVDRYQRVVDWRLLDSENFMISTLSPQTRAMWLLSTLSDSQWKEATGQGLSVKNMSDLQASLTRALLSRSYRDGEKIRSLTPAQANSVRFVIQQSVSLELMSLNPKRVSTVSLSSLLPNDHHLWHGEGFTDAESSRRLLVKQVAFQPRKSQLELSPPQSSLELALPQQSKVSDLLSAISGLIGKRVMADYRVANRQVFSQVPRARVGDVLDAIAATVHGTYRKLPSTYILVPDLQGAGQAKLKLSSWFDRVEDYNLGYLEQWLSTIAIKAQASPIHHDPHSLDEVTPIVTDPNLLTTPVPFVTTKSQFSQHVQDEIDRWAVASGKGAVDGENIGLKSEACFRLILPDGTEVTPPGNLLFLMSSLKSRQVSSQLDGPYHLNGVSVCASLVSRQRVGEVLTLLDQNHGDRLWFPLERGVDLQLLLQAPNSARFGFALNLWNRRSGNTETLSSIPVFQTVQHFPGLPFQANLTLSSAAFDVSEADATQSAAQLPNWIRRLSALGKADLLVLNPQPLGYTPATPRLSTFPLSIVKQISIEQGYSAAARETFFSDYGIDPIDIGDPRFSSETDLTNPYFPSPYFTRVFEESDARDPHVANAWASWRKFIYERNEARLRSVTEALAASKITAFVEESQSHNRCRLATHTSKTAIDWNRMAQYQRPTALRLFGYRPNS